MNRRTRQMPVALVLLLMALMAGGCARDQQAASRWPHQVVTPEGVLAPIEWSAEESAKEIAKRDVYLSESTSHHVVRVRTAEQPHTHEQEMVVTMLSGAASMYIASGWVDPEMGTADVTFVKEALRPGDVVRVPAGVTHYATNLVKDGASEAYVVFSPPMPGTEVRASRAPMPAGAVLVAEMGDWPPLPLLSAAARLFDSGSVRLLLESEGETPGAKGTAKMSGVTPDHRVVDQVVRLEKSPAGD